MRVWLIRFVLLASFLALWEITSGWLFRPFFISSPSAVLITFWKWVESGRLFYHAGITVIEAFTGFALGGLAGMAVGIVLGQSRTLADILDPFIMIFYSLPKIALAPLFVLWFGVGIDMKIILTASVVFFLVFLNTYTGVRNVSRELIAANQGLGYLLADASGQFNTAGVFAALLAIVLLALVLNFFVKILEKLVMPWHQDQELREFSI